MAKIQHIDFDERRVKQFPHTEVEQEDLDALPEKPCANCTIDYKNDGRDILFARTKHKDVIWWHKDHTK